MLNIESEGKIIPTLLEEHLWEWIGGDINLANNLLSKHALILLSLYKAMVVVIRQFVGRKPVFHASLLCVRCFFLLCLKRNKKVFRGKVGGAAWVCGLLTRIFVWSVLLLLVKLCSWKWSWLLRLILQLIDWRGKWDDWVLQVSSSCELRITGHVDWTTQDKAVGWGSLTFRVHWVPA